MTSQEKQSYFSKGLNYFNSKKFFESHEEWEQIWLQCQNRDEKLLYQSMIILAGVGVHLQKNRPAPAQRLQKLGLIKLEEIKNQDYSQQIKQLKKLYLRVIADFLQDHYLLNFDIPK
ncbi:MAG: DUF309 domain-containing protein [Candidatus Cloacimonetes bacterium]|nr:DUF309 domain-containing protein [Candidatus Cloacimonadota bacterium]